MQSRSWLVILTLCSCGLMTATLISPAAVRSHAHDAEVVAGDQLAPLDDMSAEVDFYGNEVAAAVARYKVDPKGIVYEEHSPQTEVPRLGSPKS